MFGGRSIARFKFFEFGHILFLKRKMARDARSRLYRRRSSRLTEIFKDLAGITRGRGLPLGYRVIRDRLGGVSMNIAEIGRQAERSC